MFLTKYIVFSYEIQSDGFVIDNFWALNLWQLFKYDGKYPLSLQCKRDTWYNLRPSASKDWDDPARTPRMFIRGMCDAIAECPNNIPNKQRIIGQLRLDFLNLTKEQSTISLTPFQFL